MVKREAVNVEKGKVSNPSLTKTICIRKPGTATYAQTSKFEVR